MEGKFFSHRILCAVMALLMTVFVLVGATEQIFAEPSTTAAENTEENEFGPEGEISAEGVILVDSKSGIVLFEKNPHKRLFPASTTKIMTALVALEAVKKGEVSLDQKFILSQSAFDTLAPDGSSISLKVGETMTLDDLLKGLLIASGNDAAVVIAEGIGGSIEAYVERMNQKAKSLGLSDTHFVNPHGLHDENHYTTAYDLSVMTREAMKHEKFCSIVECAHIYLAPTEMNEKRYFINTNNLVSRYRVPDFFYEYATGVKTGSTTEAGSCLVSSAEKDGRTVISVVLKAKNPVASHVESKAILEHGLDDFSKRKLARLNDIFGEVHVKQAAGDTDHIILHAESNLEVLFPNEGKVEDVQKVYKIPDKITAPVEAGQVIGSVVFVYKGQDLGEVKLVSQDNIERSIFGPVESFFEWIWSYSYVRVIVWILVAIFGILLILMVIGFARAIKKSKRKNRRHSSYHPPKY